MSRGAEQVCFIEQDAAAARVIERNIASLGVGPRAKLLRTDIGAGIRKLRAEDVRAHICFFDPPYAALPEALGNLRRATEIMHPEGIIILEHRRKDATPARAGLWSRTRLLEQGSSALSFYRLLTD